MCLLLQICVSSTPNRDGQARDPGDAAVQAKRVREPDQPEHGERVGRPQMHHRHLHEARRGQIPHHEGSQQGERPNCDPPLWILAKKR